MKRNRNFLPFLFFCFVLCLFLYSCVHRLVHIDDAYLAEQSYWFATVGKVKSELFRGLLGWENQNFVYHKLYIWQGALVIKLFGFNVYFVKSIALLYMGGFLILLTKFLNKEGFSQGERFWILTLALLNPLLFELSFVFRPDVSVTFWGLLSSYFLIHKSQNWKNTLFAAMAAGLAAATHLNGLIFISAGGLLLLYRRAWKQIPLYAFVSGVLALFYLSDVRSMSDLHTLVFQLTHDPMVISESYGVWSLPMRFIDEQRRYFHSPPEIAYSFVLLVCIAFSWRKLWNEKRDLCVYTLALACSLALLAHGKTSKYLIYLLPLHLVLAGWSYFRHTSKVKLVSFTVYGVVSLVVIWPIIKRPDQLLKDNQKWSAYMDKSSNVLAPIWFIFNNIENRQIQGTLGYEFIVMRGEGKANEEFLFKRAAEFDNKYILLNRGYIEYFNVKEKDYPPYVLIQKDSQYWLFEKRNDLAL